MLHGWNDKKREKYEMDMKIRSNYPAEILQSVQRADRGFDSMPRQILLEIIGVGYINWIFYIYSRLIGSGGY